MPFFNDPVAMPKNLCSMVTESGKTAKLATGTAMPLPLKSPYPLGIVILGFEARLRHTRSGHTYPSRGIRILFKSFADCPRRLLRESFSL